MSVDDCMHDLLIENKYDCKSINHVVKVYTCIACEKALIDVEEKDYEIRRHCKLKVYYNGNGMYREFPIYRKKR